MSVPPHHQNQNVYGDTRAVLVPPATEVFRSFASAASAAPQETHTLGSTSMIITGNQILYNPRNTTIDSVSSTLLTASGRDDDSLSPAASFIAGVGDSLASLSTSSSAPASTTASVRYSINSDSPLTSVILPQQSLQQLQQHLQHQHQHHQHVQLQPETHQSYRLVPQHAQQYEIPSLSGALYQLPPVVPVTRSNNNNNTSNNNNAPVIGAPPSQSSLPYAYDSEPTGMVNADSADPELFFPEVDTDYICKICQRVPKRASSPHCCGQISCRECLLKWLRNNPSCPNCRSPCSIGGVLPSPFVGTRLSGMNVRCPNHRGTAPQTGGAAAAATPTPDNNNHGGESPATSNRPGCNRVFLFGKEGTRLMEHVAICEYGLVECSDCGETMLRRDMTTHKPAGHNVCTRMPVLCDACGVKIPRGDLDTHNNTAAHRDNTQRKLAALGSQVQTIEASLEAHRSLIEGLKQSIADVNRSHAEMKLSYDTKLAEMEKKHDAKLAEVRAANNSAFVEFQITKWSEVKEAALFSTASPVRAWGHEWWLKVEKAMDRIGLYLCCGEEGIFPLLVDYQLMVRKRFADDAVCASVTFQTEFGKEKAWGLSKFTTMDQLIKEGAYVAAEDIITFGCLIYPVKGCQWGRNTRRAVIAPSANTVVGAIIPPPPPPSLSIVPNIMVNMVPPPSTAIART